MTKKFYLTTPIYYVNDPPHIGHTCTTLAADILARYHRLTGKEVFFLTGTDEHGAKVAEAAKKEGLNPKEFCDRVSQTFFDIWPKLNIKYDYFIRTTNPDHEKIVQEVLTKIYQKGEIYKAKYSGLYCIGCEKFITESDLVNGRCPLHPNREVTKQSEENYFFKLSKYIPTIIEAIENPTHPNHYQICPEGKRSEVLAKLKAGVNDLSISRAEVSWGIPVPWDKSQTIYVWVEALFNYYTALKIVQKENFWPADLHLIGKEILWFHTVIWQALLLAADLPLPKEILAHSFYVIDGQKMSKSLGNVISPQQLIDRYGIEGARYLVASTFPRDGDSDIGLKKFDERYGADLANGLGNLVARVLALAKRYSDGKVPKPDRNLDSHPLRIDTHIYNWKKVWKDYDEFLGKYQISEALASVWKFIAEADKYINQTEPWGLARKDLKEFNWVVYGLLDSIHQIAWQIYPFLPETAQKIARILNLEKLLIANPTAKDSWINIKPGTRVEPGEPLFPRLN
jgi:methionyl-tRNA synthetase